MLRPILDRVVLRKLVPKETKGGIQLPDPGSGTDEYGRRKGSFRAEVLAVGPGRWRDGVWTVPGEVCKPGVLPAEHERSFVVGDVVIVGKWAGDPAYDTADAELRDVLVVEESDILAVEVPEPAKGAKSHG